MRHFPIFLDISRRRIVVSGAGECAAAKLRLLLKTDADIAVYGVAPAAQVVAWAAEGRIAFHGRALRASDAEGAALLYAANDHPAEDARAERIGREAGALVNVVDNLDASDFITPAIVDRDPVTIAIGTEGAAPVLARRIKADLEDRLPVTLGRLARIGQAFRARAAMVPAGRGRRDFWSRYYSGEGERALAEGGDAGARAKLEELMTDAIETRPRDGRVALIAAGTGDPDHLTVRARRLIDEADVVVHDRSVPQPILELARREALVIEAGRDAVDALAHHSADGAQIVRLVAGDPFRRLEDETEILAAAGLTFEVLPAAVLANPIHINAEVL